MSKIIPISNKPKFILVVDDGDFGIYFYLVDNVLKTKGANNGIGVWNIKYKN